MLADLRRNWQMELLRPVLVNLATAGALFSASLLLKPVRTFLFPPPPLQDYPLSCLAEPFVAEHEGSRKLFVDFYVINRRLEERCCSRDQLRMWIAEHAPAEDRPTPDISLRYGASRGRIETCAEDKEFNRDKGRLRCIVVNEREATIVPEEIHRQAILRATLRFAAPEWALSGTTRATRSAIPFDADTLDRYQIACYSR